MASDDGNGHEPHGAKAHDAAHYIATLTGELARLAETYDLNTLAYILDMARLEAEQTSRAEPQPEGEARRALD